MEGINLHGNIGSQKIYSPAGRKIAKEELFEEQFYLNKNLWNYRKIVRFIDNDVQYIDRFGYGLCSLNHFAKTCPYEATSEEIDFLNSKSLD